MKILMLNHNVAFKGGTFFRAYHFARQMVRRGHQVTLLTISPTLRFGFREKVSDGVRIVETPDLLWGRGRSGWDPWDTLSRLLFVRGESWDLVHAFDSRPTVILPALFLQRKGIPVVLDWADWWGRGGVIEERTTGPLVRILVGPMEAYFEEAFRTHADGTTVISTALLKRALALGVSPHTIAYLPQGSDVENVQPLSKEHCRERLGLPSDIPILGYIGAFARSDAKLLVQTFVRIRERHPNCQLLLIGNHRARIPTLPGITETGYVSHDRLVQYIGACNIMLLPLKDTVASRGRWPSKLNDYLAAGRPTVATAVGDVRNLFVKHQIGRATPDTPDALAEAVGELLADERLCTELGNNARKVAETELAWPLLAEQLEMHYFQIAGRRGSCK